MQISFQSYGNISIKLKKGATFYEKYYDFNTQTRQRLSMKNENYRPVLLRNID